MTALVRHADGVDFYWDAPLHPSTGDGPFQWSLYLRRLVENDLIYEVTNRHWEPVGPTFEKRKEGSKFLGFAPGLSDNAISRNWDALIEEYTGLYSDEIETRQQFHAENKKKFGRPSQGRSEHMQFSATPALKAWLEGQVGSQESLSNVIYRLLEEKRQGA